MAFMLAGYEAKANATAERAPHPGWGHTDLPTVTAAAPEMKEGCFGMAVCNKEHTDATAHVSEGICSCRKHANPG